MEKLSQVLTRLDQFSSPVATSTPNAEHTGLIQDASPSTIATQKTVQGLSNADLTCYRPEEPTENQDLDYEPEQLRIPTSKTSPDAVLQWPVFGYQFPPNYITDAVYIHEMPNEDRETDGTSQAPRRLATAKTRSLGIDEEAIVDLVERFLELVHIKNPILDVEMLRSYTQDVVEDGLKWDSASCLVVSATCFIFKLIPFADITKFIQLLACALGCIATQFPNDEEDNSFSATALELQEQDLREGHTYYNLARRRFGLLEMGILASQCYFLAGVYEMYLMQPIPAWSHFQSATKTYHLYLQCQARRDPSSGEDLDKSSKSRSLEQRLYWSCYKSECELRAEIDSPNSSLADVHYSDMHPSPPLLEAGDINLIPNSPLYGRLTRSRTSSRIGLTAQQQQEQTWFYYLTEITLRRIVNRVLNLLYTRDAESWTEGLLLPKIGAVQQFEEQLEECCAGLPPLIQFDHSHIPDEELPYLIRSRVLEIKTLMYAPFLYHSTHTASGAPCNHNIQQFAEKCIKFSLLRMKGEPTRHRHHGTWYGLRNFLTHCLWILAAVRSGNIVVPGNWRENVEAGIGKMRFWEMEGPGVSRAIQVLDAYLHDT